MKLYLLFLISLTTLSLSAQDPVFSQFYANKVYLNPAFVGIQEGLGVNFSYRNQWRAIPKKFETYSASVELQEPCMGAGLGMTVFRDVEGEGALETTGASLVYAYIIRLPDGILRGKTKRKFVSLDVESNLHFGIEAAFVQKQIYWPRLHFSDQIDPIYGFTQASGVQSLPVSDRLQFGDANFGMLLRQNYYSAGGTRFNKTPLRLALGMSVRHLMEPSESLYRIYTVLPRRWTIHGGLEVPFKAAVKAGGGDFALLPHFKYERQGRDTIGVNQLWSYGFYMLTPTAGYFGIFHQNNTWASNQDDTKSLVFTIGSNFQSESMEGTIGVSYDYNYAGLGVTTAGVWEISTRLRFIDARGLCGRMISNRRGQLSGKRSRRTSNERIMNCDNFF